MQTGHLSASPAWTYPVRLMPNEFRTPPSAPDSGGTGYAYENRAERLGLRGIDRFVDRQGVPIDNAVVVRVNTRPLAVPAGAWSAPLLDSFLRNASTDADACWRRWCAELLRTDRLGPEVLQAWWQVVAKFDPVLAAYAADPVPVPAGTTIVAGSGKERFKTFNVSTAAAVLAAAAGVPVVKGVSRSVSAVSGAADILDALGIRPVTRPDEISSSMERHGIAFVSYPQFCPRYAARYDGVFEVLNPASFFMPVTALCVAASGFVLGLAHNDVSLAAAAIKRIRPGFTAGAVVSTELTPGETVDEHSDVGTTRLARLTGDAIRADIHRETAPDVSWRRAVAHRPTHAGNAAAAAHAIAPGPDTPATRLVEANAALILSVNRSETNLAGALDQVRQARSSGRAERLLTALAHP